MLQSKNDMLDLGRQQAALFTGDDHLAYCEVLITCYCPRQILLTCYHGLVYRGKITPVEELLRDQKEFAWEKAKSLAKGRLGKKALIEVVKAFLTIEYFLNL